jgi:hypothetical protein
MKQVVAMAIALVIFVGGCRIDSDINTDEQDGGNQPEELTGLANLPDGTYQFVSPELIEEMPGNYKRILFEKHGSHVVGINLLYPDDNPCFQGTLKNENIVDVTVALAPFGDRPNWEFSSDDAIALEGYAQKDGDIDTELISLCLEAFRSEEGQSP